MSTPPLQLQHTCREAQYRYDQNLYQTPLLGISTVVPAPVPSTRRGRAVTSGRYAARHPIPSTNATHAAPLALPRPTCPSPAAPA
eukprot:6188588-Pleurochrysis_carterae.AAC.9